MDDARLVVIVVVIVVVITEVLNPNDIVFTVMGMMVELWLMAVVVVPLRWRHVNHSWVMESLKLWVRNRMHESLLFHFSRSLAVPYLLLCKPSRVRPGHPLVRVPSVTSDEVETLMTRFVPGSRAPFFDFDAANELGPAHCM